MLIKNKLTHDTLELSLQEFKVEFRNELHVAIESYIKTEKAKPYFRLHEPPEDDFYFDLQWNFNNFSNSVWFIERM